MKLLILYDRDGWAYCRRAEALRKHSPEGWQVTVARLGTSWPDMGSPADITLLLDYASIVPIRHRMIHGWTCPLVVSFNAGPMRRRGMWQRVYDAADFVICNSQATYESWGEYPRRCCISNGVDLETFKVVRPIQERADKCLWYGRASKHWKGLREVLQPLAKLLGEHGFTFDFRELPAGDPPMDTPGLVEWYNSGAYVLCASEAGYEGTPNLVTEAVACGCVAVTTRTGNVLEWGVDGENCLLADRNPVSFLDKLFEARARRAELSKAGVAALQSWDWGERAPWFYRLFGRIVNEGAGAVEPFSYMDNG
jgi:glycosyltransferase involved in cell wall biosynthesis